MQVFIAIDISDKAKKEVEKLYKILKRKHWKVRLEPIEKLHLTLVFFGNIGRKNIKGEKVQSSKCKVQSYSLKFKMREIRDCVKRAVKEIKPFKISFKGLGCFPDYDYPRVIWLGLKGDLKSLARLQKQILSYLTRDRQLNKIINKSKHKHRFSAHITLGRIKKARIKERREIGRQIKKFKEFKNLKFKTFSELKMVVDRVVIYESKLLRLGSEYKKLAEISL